MYGHILQEMWCWTVLRQELRRDRPDAQDTWASLYHLYPHYSFLSKHEVAADNVYLVVSSDGKVKEEEGREGINDNLDEIKKAYL